MLLLRMAGVSRELAARLLAGPGDLLEIADAGRAIARFDAITASRSRMRRANGCGSTPTIAPRSPRLEQDHGQRARLTRGRCSAGSTAPAG